MMRLRRWMTVPVLAFALVGCGDDNDQAGGDATGASSSEAAAEGNAFVGKVEGTNAYIGVLTYADGKAFAYVCDGTDTTEAKVAANLKGTVAGGKLALKAVDGVEVVGSVDREASGTVTIDGAQHAFTAEAVDHDGYASLYAAGDGADTTARWVVLDDQTVRGATRQRGIVQVAPPIRPWVDPDPEPVVQLPGVTGPIHSVRLQPWVDPNPDPWVDPEPNP